MSPSTTTNLPACLKARCVSWPIFRVDFEELTRAVSTCGQGEVVVGRFSPPLHTAYLVDVANKRLLRCVQSQPMRVQLRRLLGSSQTVTLAAAGAGV